MGDATFQAVVFDACISDHFFQRRVAVSAQRHDLRHIALERGVVALAEELQTPAPLGRIQLRAKQQRRGR